MKSVNSRPELVPLRDAIIRHLHGRASIDDVRDAALQASRSMQADRMTMEEILIVLKGSVTLAATHVTHAAKEERAVSLRAQMAPWLVSLYMNASGEFDESHEG